MRRPETPFEALYMYDDLRELCNAERQAIYQQSWSCEHLEFAVRYRDALNGRRYYGQCMRCGRSVGQLARSTILPEQLQAAREFDDSVSERWEARQQESATRIREKYEALAWRRAQDDLRAQQEAYEQYMSSAAWKRKRMQVLEREQHLCQGCRINRAVHVHHTTYDHFGDELLFELVAVCQSCHERIHGRPL